MFALLQAVLGILQFIGTLMKSPALTLTLLGEAIVFGVLMFAIPDLLPVWLIALVLVLLDTARYFGSNHW